MIQLPCTTMQTPGHQQACSGTEQHTHHDIIWVPGGGVKYYIKFPRGKIQRKLGLLQGGFYFYSAPLRIGLSGREAWMVQSPSGPAPATSLCGRKLPPLTSWGVKSPELPKPPLTFWRLTLTSDPSAGGGPHRPNPLGF